MRSVPPPREDVQDTWQWLRERFASWGEWARGSWRACCQTSPRQGTGPKSSVLDRMINHQDVVAALERAVRYQAFSCLSGTHSGGRRHSPRLWPMLTDNAPTWNTGPTADGASRSTADLPNTSYSRKRTL